MSKTPDEFLDNVLTHINNSEASLRALAQVAEGQANINSALASMIIEDTLRELDSLGDALGCLELIKFKMLISKTPEAWWPKPDIQKGQ